MKSSMIVKWWGLGLAIVLLHKLPRENNYVCGNPTSWEASGTLLKKPREICRLTSEGKMHLHVFGVVILLRLLLCVSWWFSWYAALFP